MRFLKKYGWIAPAITLFLCLFSQTAQASEIDLKIPLLDVEYNFWGHAVTGSQILLYGLIVCALGMLFGFYEFCKIKKMPAHKSMLNMASLIYETCKTYMKQQAVLLVILEAFIAVCIFYYFFFLNQTPLPMVMNILLWSVLGILGSFSVAWFGMRINTYANARTAFASLKGKAFPVMSLPLRSGMSIGVLLICVELVMMIIILLFIPRENAGACFIGFAIGESLGASALGRFQFSIEKVYKVRYFKPISPLASTTGFTVSTPCLCPYTRSKPLCSAQRPLPSMIIAICSGKPAAIISSLISCIIILFFTQK